MTPCIIFEDEHLLVANKPAGMNTHAPSPYAGEGLYEWLRNRERRWATLAIIHRLDKETSGVIVFSKSPLSNRSLTQQFTDRKVKKRYLLLTDRRPAKTALLARSRLRRAGEKYVSSGREGVGESAETKFQLLDSGGAGGKALMSAEPLSGRTHQIRVHAADNGFPILGDTLYGGTFAERVFLHASEISFQHPATAQPVTFKVPENFAGDSRLQLRAACVDGTETTAFRLVHGASDGWPGWHVDKAGDWLLSSGEEAHLHEPQEKKLTCLLRLLELRGAYHKALARRIPGTGKDASPQLIRGEPALERFAILENGIRYGLSFSEGYSIGLFLDQRDNRRRLLTGHIAAGFELPTGPADAESGALRPPEVLNAFAYTCGFSVCAAMAGARVTSLDLSRKYLAWGKDNFVLNQIDPTRHDFIYGDVFDWFRRLRKQKRSFEIILLDPPTFSRSKEHGLFQAQKDYGRLVAEALPLLRRAGVLFASTNAAEWPPADFLAEVRGAIAQAGRNVGLEFYAPQPPDFPVSRGEPPYLKTAWFRVD